jgi:hypothetical protein
MAAIPDAGIAADVYDDQVRRGRLARRAALEQADGHAARSQKPADLGAEIFILSDHEGHELSHGELLH